MTPPGGLKIGGEEVRRVEGARFLGVWVDEGLRWTGQIGQVRAKVGQLLGVLGRARAVLGGGALLSLYNGLVLPHLQYCLMVWGDFQGGAERHPWTGPPEVPEAVCGAGSGEAGAVPCRPLLCPVFHVKSGGPV